MRAKRRRRAQQNGWSYKSSGFFGSDAGAATIRQVHAQRLLAAAQGAETQH
ncbi:hypothetical protein SCH4B_2318 [Ruegeria sp. TrichCH4B]|nr:hypothetical protein SCH4B_2318 [Ruegeria sp. TrichCH4B]